MILLFLYLSIFTLYFITLTVMSLKPEKKVRDTYNQKENKVFYQYANVPLSDSERIGLLEDALNEILLGGMLNGNQ